MFFLAELLGQTGYYLIKGKLLFENQVRDKGLTVLNEHGSVTYRPEHLKPHRNGDFPINRAGYVITANQPSEKTHLGNIVIIGGSTVRGSTGVENTIASHLQQCLLENQIFLTVHNAGRDGRYSYTSLRYLIETIKPSLKPKIVVQVNGFNDIGHQTITRIEQAEAREGQLSRYKITDKLNGIIKENGVVNFDLNHQRLYSDINQQRFLHIYNDGYRFSDVINYFHQEFLYLKNFLFVFRLAYKIAGNDTYNTNDERYNDRNSLINDEIIEGAAQDYVAITNATRGYLNSVGIKYIHALQPVPSYKKPLSQKEQSYLLEINERKGIDLSYHVNSFYQKLNRRIQDGNFKTLNLSTIFKDVKDTRYVDSSHYNTEANVTIAKILCSEIVTHQKTSNAFKNQLSVDNKYLN